MPRATPRRDQIALIGSALSWGSGRRIGANGARRLRDNGLDRHLSAARITASWHDFIEECPQSSAAPVDAELALSYVGDHCRRVADAVSVAVRVGYLPVVLGGDNAGTIGFYTGLAAARDNSRPIGVVWIDAHPDCNDWTSSPSKAAHGMVVSTICGFGPGSLPCPSVGSIVPTRIAMIGIRSIDPGEQQFIDRHNIAVWSAAETRAAGLNIVLGNALDAVTTGGEDFAISLDLDAIDPSQAPGVAFAESGGLEADALCDALTGIGHKNGFQGIEISEFAPEFDVDSRTETLVERLLKSVFGTRS